MSLAKETNARAETRSAFHNLTRQIYPEILSACLDYRSALRGGKPRQEAKQELKTRVRNNLAKSLASGLWYQITANTYGVGAWNLSGTSSETQVVLGNSSSFAVNTGKLIASFVPPASKDTIATVAFVGELALSVVRIAIEQKLYLRFGMTSDPAGTLTTPLLMGAIEIPYKLLQKYSPDADERLAISATEIVGNLARLLNDGIIYAVFRMME